MLANFLSGWIGKAVLGVVGAIGIAAVIFILVLQGQIKDKDLAIRNQQIVIQAQSQKIEALNLQALLDKTANDVLNERLKTRAAEIDNLNSDIENILKQGAENDGPVAPVLEGIVRAPAAPKR